MTPSHLPLGASVIVCCHDSAARIARALSHLGAQRCEVPWEVVLVANACTDDTVAIAQRAWRECGAGVPLAVVEQPVLGLAHARAAGIAQAHYRYAILCDDDNWLDPHYVEAAVRIMESRPDVGVLGGRSRPAADGPLPAWFESCAQDFAAGPQAGRSGDVTRENFLWGAGMVLRTRPYLEMRAAGARELLRDREGAALSSGGDTEMCLWFMMAGFRLWYDERLSLAHFMPAPRLTREYHARLHDGFRRSWEVLGRYRTVLDSLAARSPWLRLRRLAGGIARALSGRDEGRWIVQAYCPVPGIVVDRRTREIQLMARAIRGAFARPEVS